MALTPGRVVDGDGRVLGSVPAVQLVTVGQRRGLGLPGGGAPAFATAVDVATGTVTVGPAQDLLVDELAVGSLGWVGPATSGEVEVQLSAHGAAHPASVASTGGRAVIRLAERVRRVAPGQSVVLYRDDDVLGGGTAC